MGRVTVSAVPPDAVRARTPLGYTHGMKTAISIPDDVFEDAERLALRLGHSRSKLFIRALREFVVRHEPDHVAAALDAVVAEEPTVDAFLERAGRRVVERTEW